MIIMKSDYSDRGTVLAFGNARTVPLFSSLLRVATLSQQKLDRLMN